MKADDIRFLRDKTQLSISSIKNALIAAGGDVEKAQEILNIKDVINAEKLGTRKAKEGRIHTYLHNNGRFAVMVEINCETDFAANTVEFREFCERIAIQIAGASPLCISKENIPQRDMDAYVSRLVFSPAVSNAPDEKAKAKAIDDKLDSWYSEICLLEQNCIEAPTNKTINQLRMELSAKLGENVVIKRFVRWELGNN